MAIKEYPLPDAARVRAASRSTSTTSSGTATTRAAFSAGSIQDRQVEEFASPGGPNTRPYAIVVTSDDIVWYCETGIDDKNVLVRFDPATKAMQTWAIPSGGQTVRNMVIGKT